MCTIASSPSDKCMPFADELRCLSRLPEGLRLVLLLVNVIGRGVQSVRRASGFEAGTKEPSFVQQVTVASSHERVWNSHEFQA